MRVTSYFNLVTDQLRRSTDHPSPHNRQELGLKAAYFLSPIFGMLEGNRSEGFGVLEALGGSCTRGELVAAAEEAATIVWSARSGFGSLDNLDAREKTPCMALHWNKTTSLY